MNKFEYLLLVMSKSGLSRVTITLDKAITDADTLLQLDEALRNQENESGEKDETMFVLNYKLLKSYTI